MKNRYTKKQRNEIYWKAYNAVLNGYKSGMGYIFLCHLLRKYCSDTSKLTELYMVAPFNWGGGIPWDWNYSDSQNDYNDYKTTALAFMIAMTEKIISNPQPKRLNQHGNENKPKRQRTN